MTEKWQIRWTQQ